MDNDIDNDKDNDTTSDGSTNVRLSWKIEIFLGRINEFKKVFRSAAFYLNQIDQLDILRILYH